MKEVPVSIYGRTVAHSAIVHSIFQCEFCDTCLRDPQIKAMVENERRIIKEHWLKNK